jgi:uncharacterized membrane protein
VSVVAAIRPDEVNFPLLLHVFGAMLLLGTLFTVATAIVLGWRRTDPVEAMSLTRFGLRTLLMGVLPAYVLMRIGAQWTESEENLPDDFEAAWLDIGYITADAGALLILISLGLSGFGLWRLRQGRGGGLAKAVGVIAILLLAAFVVAVWAMTAKPD